MNFELLLVAAAFCVFALGMHLASLTITLIRLLRSDPPTSVSEETPKVSLLRPVCGLENHLAETLGSGYGLDYPDYEILFCVQSPTDLAIPLIKEMIANHPETPSRLLIGDDPVSRNPKLNNLVKGWRAATADWIIMADSNVLLPRNYIHSLLVRWHPDTGLVSSPPVGLYPDGLAASLECAFLNSYQARWQIASDQVGLGFAQGKTLFWRRDIFERAGGFSKLATEMAEDVASTKLVRGSGLRVRLAKRPYPQLIGSRSFAEVWDRQLRWARLRRMGFLSVFLTEVFTGILFPIISLITLVAAGWVSPIFVPVFVIVWYGAEWLLSRSAGWPSSALDLLAWVMRDILIPVVWVLAWRRSKVLWHGVDVASAEGPAMKPGVND